MHGYGYSIFYFSVPPPLVAVKSSMSNPIRPIGSDVNLTCSIDLNAAVDVQVNVNVVWTAPDGIMVLRNHTAMLSEIENNTLTSTAVVDSFVNFDSGYYTCIATVMLRRRSPYINESGAVAANKTRITTGTYTFMQG